MDVTSMECDVDVLSSSTLPVNAASIISLFVKSLKGKLKGNSRGNNSSSKRAKKRPKLDESSTKEVFQTNEAKDKNCSSMLGDYATSKILFRITEKIVSFGNVILARCQEGDVLTTPFTFSSSGGLVEPTLFRSQLRPLQSTAHCTHMNWPILLVGTHSSGKSTLLQIISQCCGRFLDEISLSSSSDVSDLIGCFEQSLKRLLGIDMKQRSSLNPQHLVNQIKEFISNVEAVTKRYPHATEILNARIVEANHLLSFVKVSRTSASRDKSKSINFHWVDGPLIRAILEGYWFHLENVNLCPASVLDRINPLL